MFAIVIGWWVALLQPATVSATATARGATADYARVESEYQCGKQLADRCRVRGLEPPQGPTLPWPDCTEDQNGMTACEIQCAGECTTLSDDL